MKTPVMHFRITGERLVIIKLPAEECSLPGFVPAECFRSAVRLMIQAEQVVCSTEQ